MTLMRLPSSVPYPWVVMALCVASLTALASTFVGFGALFPFIQDELKINRAEIGLISSGRVLGGIGTSLLAGLLADVVGVRRLQSATLLSVVVCLVLFSQMQSLFQGVLLALLLGVASAGSFPCFVKAIMDWMDRRSRGLAMGTAEASFPVGGILSAMVLTLIAEAYSWRVSVLVIAAGVAVCTIAFFLIYRDPDKGAKTAAAATDDPAREKLKRVLRSRAVWLAAAVAAALGIIMTVVVTFLILFLKETMGMSSVLAGACMSVSLAGGAVSRIAWGVISDHYLGGRRTGLLALVSALAGVSIALLVLLPNNASLWGRDAHRLLHRDDMFRTVLPRPRDLIHFVKAAVNRAINRGREKVLEDDFLKAREQYSQYAFDSILKEDDPGKGKLEQVLYEFAGAAAELNREEIACRFASAEVESEDVEFYLNLLCDISFLGIETTTGFRYSGHEEERRTLRKVAKVLAARNDRNERFAINPAFYQVLQIE